MQVVASQFIFYNNTRLCYEKTIRDRVSYYFTNYKGKEKKDMKIEFFISLDSYMHTAFYLALSITLQ